MDSRKGTTGAVTRAGACGGEEHPRSKAAHAGSPWITALIESLSDVPWSRVILLPKQLLSSVVYSHLFPPAESEPQTPTNTSHSLSPSLVFDTYDLARSLAATPPSAFGQNSHRLVIRFYRLTTISQFNRFNRIDLSYIGCGPSFYPLVKTSSSRNVVWTALIVGHRFE